MHETFVALVSPRKKEFILHTEIATRSSKFFRTAVMNREWRESQEKQITLYQVDEDDFEGYLQWLNTGELTFADGDPNFDELADFYILGDVLDDEGFRNATLNRFAEHACAMVRSPEPGTIAHIWSKTPENSPLRKMVLETWSADGLEHSISLLRNRENGFPEDFALDYFIHLMETQRIVKEVPSVQQHNRDIRDYAQKLIEQLTDETTTQVDACDGNA